jgi:ATP-binding cassette subfamily C (CFTR/MRP) protein 4
LLLDDPLSALDSIVKKKIFEGLILKHLKDKTRILVTHSLDFIQHSDRIIIMNKGEISAIGTYNELKDSKLLIDALELSNKHKS